MTGFARDLLAVADNLRRAVAALPAEGFDGVRAGIEATERELTAIFGRHGITRRSKPPARSSIPTATRRCSKSKHEGLEPGTIVAELQAGYVIKDRLLRPALVSVAKA